jgi:hypothetical protein
MAARGEARLPPGITRADLFGEEAACRAENTIIGTDP